MRVMIARRWTFLFAEARLGHDAVTKCCGVNHASARQVYDPGRNDLAPLLIARENLKVVTGFFKRFGHRLDRRRTKGCLISQMFTDGHDGHC